MQLFCEDCVADRNGVWVHLRRCVTCNHVACCNSSPHKHATAHAAKTGHNFVQSVEPGEAWVWSYAADNFVSPQVAQDVISTVIIHEEV